MGSAKVKSSADDARLGLPCRGNSDDDAADDDDGLKPDSRSPDSRIVSFVLTKSNPNLLLLLLLVLLLLVLLLPMLPVL